jgi:hypothetical protein
MANTGAQRLAARAQQLLDMVTGLRNASARPVAEMDDRLALVRAANRDAFGLVFQYFRGQWEAILGRFGPAGAGALLEQVPPRALPQPCRNPALPAACAPARCRRRRSAASRCLTPCPTVSTALDQVLPSLARAAHGHARMRQQASFDCQCPVTHMHAYTQGHALAHTRGLVPVVRARPAVA